MATGWYLRRKIYAFFHRSDVKRESEMTVNDTEGQDSSHP